MLGIATFALLTAVGALIRIPLPFTPVPITLQTLFVLLAGVYLGGRDGAFSQLAYLGLGAIGLPLFAGGGLLGATGGFLLSFPIAALLVGSLLRPGDSAWRAIPVLAAANLVIFGLGASWLARTLDVSAAQALSLAVVPFLPGAVLKLAIVTGLVARPPFTR
jgi:biotin transport system substrate-specific component